MSKLVIYRIQPENWPDPDPVYWKNLAFRDQLISVKSFTCCRYYRHLLV